MKESCFKMRKILNRTAVEAGILRNTKSGKETPRWPFTEANLYHRVIDVGANLAGFQNPPFFKGMWAHGRKFSSLYCVIG